MGQYQIVTFPHCSVQNFLDEHDVNSKTKMPLELASKFFELLDAGKKLSEKTQIVVHDTINPKGLPTQKYLSTECTLN